MAFRVGIASIPILLATVSVIGVSACSGGAAVAHPTASRSAPLSQSSQIRQSDQLTGTQLTDALLPAAAFPSGFRIDQSAAYNSGNRLETGPAKHNLDSMSCANFAKFYTRAGFGENALAADDYTTHPGDYSSKHGATLSQMVSQFASGRQAQAYWRGLRAIDVRCPGWAVAPPSEITSQLSAVRFPGALAFRLNFTVADEKLGTIRLESIVAVIGQDVFDVDASAIGRSIPARPSVRTMLTELAARLQGR